MSKISKLSLIGTLLALVFGFAFSFAPARAAEDTINIYVKHDINGRSLGYDKALPVDVFVNGGYAFTFEFGDSISTQLPAGAYSILAAPAVEGEALAGGECGVRDLREILEILFHVVGARSTFDRAA